MCSFLETSQIDIENCEANSGKLLRLGLTTTISLISQNILQGEILFKEGQVISASKLQELINMIAVKFKYLNGMDKNLIDTVKESIVSYFVTAQRVFIVAFSIFAVVTFAAMIYLAFFGVGYLL